MKIRTVPFLLVTIAMNITFNIQPKYPVDALMFSMSDLAGLSKTPKRVKNLIILRLLNKFSCIPYSRSINSLIIGLNKLSISGLP